MKKISSLVLSLFAVSLLSVSCAKKPVVINDGFVLVTGGTYKMGSNDIRVPWGYYDHPEHEASVSDFYISPVLVTQKDFEEVMGYNNSFYQGNDKGKIVEEGEEQTLRPVEKITWYEAIVFCNKMSAKMNLEKVYYMKTSDSEQSYDETTWGNPPEKSSESWNKIGWNKDANGYRLLTEAEWEYAARGGAETQFNSAGFNYDDEDINDFCWNDKNSKLKTHQIKLKKPNTLGLYDMIGNVWEFCWDWFDEDYYTSTAASELDACGPSTADFRVVRGCAWDDYDVSLSYVSRGSSSPHLSSRRVGMRLARSVPVGKKAKNKKNKTAKKN